MRLDKYISVDRKISRSVNLERDATDLDQIKRFQITPIAKHVLKRFADALDGDPIYAWSLTGPYGSGKSAFCNYLFALCSNLNTAMQKVAFDKLVKCDGNLAKRFSRHLQESTNHRFICLRGISEYESLNKTLLRALHTEIQKLSLADTNMSAPMKEIQLLHNRSSNETSAIMALIKKIHGITNTPLLIVIDEFGKNLEFMTHNPSQGDIHILQILAESGIAYVWVNLHQAFSDYASSFSEIQKNEWSKIQGRFEDISYSEPPSRIIELIISAISHGSLAANLEKQIDKWSKLHAQLLKQIKLTSSIPPLGITEIKKLYPFHPLAAIILGELSHRFAQNDRTIFSFLANGAPRTFGEFLSLYSIEPHVMPPTLSLSWLYDYFCEITVQNYGDRSATQKWIEIQSLIAEHSDLPRQELSLLKTIGVLNLLSYLPGIKASKEMIYFSHSVSDQLGRKRIDKILQQFISRRVVFYRNYVEEYRLWEGTDFDLEDAIREERARLSTIPIEKILDDVIPQPNVIAARHSYQTGTIRAFTQFWITMKSLSTLTSSEFCPDMESDGYIWLTLGENEDLLPTLIDKTQKLPVIIGYIPYLGQVKELGLDALAAKKVFETNPQLVHDGVARREARYRTEVAFRSLRDHLEDILSLPNSKVKWFALGKEQLAEKGKSLSNLVSLVCDSMYHMAPDIHMEMINYHQLSSATARAQRELAEAMVACEIEEQLAFEGFGPEVAIYRALFKSTGLHVKTSNGTFRFVRPSHNNEKQAKLADLWDALDETFENLDHDEIEVSVFDLCQMLQRRPFGLRAGPIPLFLCHYIIVHDDEIALYQEGVFKPIFGKAEAALLLKRPDLFTLRFHKPLGINREVIQAYMMALNTETLHLGATTRNTSLLKIVAPLAKFMSTLPEYTKNTSQVSLAAQKVRDIVLTAREPIRLLFHDIPEALGIPHPNKVSANNSWKTEFYQRLQDVLVELHDAYNNLNENISKILMEAFEYETSENMIEFRHDIQSRAAALVPFSHDQNLKTILNAMKNSVGDDYDWIRGIASIVMKKPVDAWQDRDLEPWSAAIHDLADRIEAFEALVSKQAGIRRDCLVLSLTRFGGTTKRQVVKVTQKDRKQLQKKTSNLLVNLSKKEQEQLCALLMVELLEE